MISRIDHVSVAVGDIERLCGFSPGFSAPSLAQERRTRT